MSAGQDYIWKIIFPLHFRRPVRFYQSEKKYKQQWTKFMTGRIRTYETVGYILKDNTWIELNRHP